MNLWVRRVRFFKNFIDFSKFIYIAKRWLEVLQSVKHVDVFKKFTVFLERNMEFGSIYLHDF